MKNSTNQSQELHVPDDWNLVNLPTSEFSEAVMDFH